MVLSITVADAFFIRAFKTFLAGGYGSPFGIQSMVIEPKAYLLTATYLKFHDMMRLSVWIGGCVVMLVALGVASWFTRRFSQPISGFASFADRIGHGAVSYTHLTLP